MKIFLIIFSVAGLCFGFDSSNHFKYKYFASFKVGIPDDGDQVTGLAFKAVLDVFLENNDGIAILKLSDVSTLSFNEDLGISEEIDFTDERFHPFEDEDLRRIVEQPFRANLRDSEPFAIEYEETDHRWLSNVRKGIAVMLKNEILKGNFATQEKDSISSLFHQGHLVNNFIVEEETLFGICKAKYKIHQIPETMFTGSSDLTPTRQEGARNDLWHVSRSTDFDNCKEIVAMHVHTTNNRRHNQKKLDFTRTSVSSYVLRGSPGHFDIYSVVTEGATTYPLSLFKEQEAQSTVKQKLVLIDDSTSEAPELGINLKRSATWMNEVWSPFLTPKEGKPHPWIVYPNKNEPERGYEIFGTKKYDDDQIAAVKIKILEIINDVSQRLTDLHQEAGDPPPDAISESLEMATIYFRFLKKKDILKIFDHIYEEKVGIERLLVINAAVSSGFNEAMEAVMDYMEEGKIRPFQVFTTFLTLPRNSFGSLNTSRIMDYLLHQEKPSEFLPVFAHYLSEYCIHRTHTYVPIAGDAECDSLLITRRFIPYLKDLIYNEDLTWERVYAIKVLDLLRSSFTFEIVSPLIDGRVKSPVALKVMAVQALENWHIYPENHLKTPIMDLLMDVYSDASQDFKVRIAALMAIISWQPSTKFWYDLAQRTWNDPSNEFASFASYLIKIYAEGELPTSEKQSEGAAYALKFSKPPSNTELSYHLVLSKEFFKKRAKISLLYQTFTKGNYEENMINILTNIKHLSLLKIETISFYDEIVNLNGTVQKGSSDIPYAEFLHKFYKEINFEEYPTKVKKYSEIFMSIFDDAFIKRSSFESFEYVGPDPSTLLFGTYLYLTDKSDFLPNELGLPLYTHSSLPTAVGITFKFLNRTSELLFGKDFLLRFSSVYSTGISIFLPWNHQFCTAYVRSNLELTLPVGMKVKPNNETEDPAVSSKTNWDIAYKRKFPLLRLSNTPMTITYDTDPRAENIVINYEIIKKRKINENRINKVDPYTGIKYDLIMKADTPNSLSLRNFLQFPDITFGVWSFDFYLDPEESETSEMVITESKDPEVIETSDLAMVPTEWLQDPEQYEGSDFNHYSEEESLVNFNDSLQERSYQIWKKLPHKDYTKGLLDPEQYEGSDFSHYSEEESAVNFNDSLQERSYKMWKILPYKGYVRYRTYKFDFNGKVSRHYETFNLVNHNKVVEDQYRKERSDQILGFTFTNTKLEENIQMARSICFKLHTSDYGFVRSYYDPSSAFQNYQTKETTLEILRGCTENIFTTNVFYNISEERSNEIKKYCKANYGEENCYVMHEYLLNHDDIEVTLSEEKIPFIEEFFKLLPVTGFGYEIPSYDAKFNIQRNTYNGKWDLYLENNSKTVHLSTFSENIFFKYFLSYPHEIVELPKEHSKCTLTTNSIKTFDGAYFNYNLSDCWTLASGRGRTSEDNIFLIRRPQGESSIPDFKYIIPESRRVIEFSNNEIKVNGSVVHKILEGESYVSETIENLLTNKRGNIYLEPNIVITRDKIEYYKIGFANYRYNGICGTVDEENFPKLIGPKKCVYNDGRIFTSSWTGGESENCDSAILKEFRKGVEDYQTKCEPYYNQLKESPMNHRCLFFGWKTLETNENSYCISAQPLPFCSSDCDIKKVKTVKIAYKCWSKEKAPSRLRTSIENKDDIVTDPISADPYFYEFLSTEIAKICKKI